MLRKNVNIPLYCALPMLLQNILFSLSVYVADIFDVGMGSGSCWDFI